MRTPVAQLSALCVLTAAITIACYNQAYQRAQSVIPATSARPYALAVVEADELGWFWNDTEPTAAIRLVRQSENSGNTAVVVFVHGWEHNAAPDDQNLTCFEATLAGLSHQLNTASAAQMRARAGVSGGMNVVGIYVSWRGKSVPNWLGPAQYFSFWSRKEGANRAGRGDLRGFLQQLGRIYDEAEEDSTRRSQFSLVIVGHSFGGQVVFRAVADQMEGELIRARGDEAWTALRGKPTTPTDPKVIHGVGDLVILVNPAVEATVFEPLKRLESSLRFDSLQTPAMVVFSAENDFARKVAFPIGRTLGTLGEPTSDSVQGHMGRSALGVYSPQLTHRLIWDPPPVARLARAITAQADSADSSRSPSAEEEPTCKDLTHSPADIAQDDSWQPQIDAGHPGSVDFTADGHASGAHLQPLGSDRLAFAPFMVVKTDKAIIDNHNGFFSYRFIDFLLRYVSDIQAKRLSTRAPRNVRAIK